MKLRKKEEELKELEECTFHPVTTPLPHSYDFLNKEYAYIDGLSVQPSKFHKGGSSSESVATKSTEVINYH